MNIQKTMSIHILVEWEGTYVMSSFVDIILDYTMQEK